MTHMKRFPISRDPPEGGTLYYLRGVSGYAVYLQFPISRDTPEGGTPAIECYAS